MTPDLINAHLRTLPLAHVRAQDEPFDVAARWLQTAGAAGWSLPLALAHDVGLLLTRPPARIRIDKPAHLPYDEDTSAYVAFLHKVQRHPLVRELPLWQPRLSDAALSVVLARLVEGLALPAQYRPPTGPEGVVFIQELEDALRQADPAAIWRETAFDDRPDWAQLLPREQLARIESNLAQLDPAELRFLARYGPPLGGSPDPRELADLLALTGLPEQVRLAVSQVLKLLPRVSQARTVGGIQTYPEGGYEGLARKGSLDSLLLSELAYPEDMFLHRYLNHEALYYGRERSRERRRELAYIVVQAGMGLGEDSRVLSRALLLALSQVMQRRGYEVLYSFAGRDLTDPQPIDKPGEAIHALYYRDEGWTDEVAALQGVLKRLKGWRETYKGRQVLWVLGEHFDADGHEDRVSVYRGLRQEGGQQAWYIRTAAQTANGHPQPAPPSARQFEAWQAVDTSLLWQGVPPPEPRKLLFPPKPGWHRQRDTIEGYGFRDGAHDVIHFTHEAQWAAWHELAEMENAPDVDDYLRTLAPPDMIYIPAGAFLMGSPDDDPDAHDREKPQHEVWLAGYYMDRTPVTNAQYRAFMEAGGYDTEAYWTPAGWAEKTQRNWREPRWWNDNQFTGDDKPVVGVSWYEALAYARWAGKALPTEAHWEKAASWDPAAGQRRTYPWGDAWAEGRCNYNRTENGTTAVGKYSPEGDSAYGLVDCAGNVWEWCSTRWGTNWQQPDYLYPHEPDDGREDLSGGNEMLRIMRGGSWRSNSTGVLRCGFRDWNNPSNRVIDWGFRCLSPTHSSEKSF